MEEIMMKI